MTTSEDDPKGADDYAFSPSLCAYKTGRLHRVEQRVIRYRGQKGPASRLAQATWDHKETSGAGVSWSTAELAIAGVADSELAVVVGELLPRALPDDARALLTKGPYTKSVTGTDADIAHYPILDHLEGTLVVVRLLSHAKNNYYVLVNKQDGLCGILPVPRETEDRLFFYREWTATEERVTQKKYRHNRWGEKVKEFVDERKALLSNDSIPLASDLVKPTPFPIDTNAALEGLVTFASSIYELTGSKSVLGLAPVASLSSSSALDENLLLGLFKLINGSGKVTHDELAIATKEFKKICGLLVPGGLKVDENSMALIAKGLRDPKCSIVQPLDQSYIPAFVANCFIAAERNLLDPKTLLAQLEVAYRTATVTPLFTTGTHHPGDIHGKATRNDANAREAAVVVLEYIKMRIELVIQGIHDISKAKNQQIAAMALGNRQIDITLRQIGDSVDFNELREHLLHVYGHFANEGLRPLESLLGHLQALCDECDRRVAQIRKQEL